MRAFLAILSRDIRLAFRTGGSWILGAVFMAVFISLCAIALGGQMSELRRLGSALLWLAIVFSMLLSFATIFQADFRQGTLTQIYLSGTSPLTVVLAKWAAFLCLGFLPLFVVTPIMSTFLGLNGKALLATLLALSFAAPALAAYVTLAGAIFCGRTGAGFLAVLLVTPFLVPLLIFGLEASQGFLNQGWSAVELRLLAGVSLLSIAVGLPASAAALRVNLEPS